MTIRIDDSGWGSPIGGTIIAGLRVESSEYASAVIPVEQFQGGQFERKVYLEGARRATAEVLAQLKHVPSEPLEICTGYVHTGTRQWLTAMQFRWTTTKVEGELQRRIEQTLWEYLKSLGFEFHQSTEQYGSLFREAIAWLKGGDPNARAMLPERMAVAKTGWGTWRFYETLPYDEAREKSRLFKAQRSSGRWHRRRRW